MPQNNQTQLRPALEQPSLYLTYSIELLSRAATCSRTAISSSDMLLNSNSQQRHALEQPSLGAATSPSSQDHYPQQQHAIKFSSLAATCPRTAIPRSSMPLNSHPQGQHALEPLSLASTCSRTAISFSDMKVCTVTRTKRYCRTLQRVLQFIMTFPRTINSANHLSQPCTGFPSTFQPLQPSFFLQLAGPAVHTMYKCTMYCIYNSPGFYNFCTRQFQ